MSEVNVVRSPRSMRRRVAAQARLEVSITLRNGENLLALAVIPLGILVFFTLVDVLPHGGARPVDALVPAVLALAVISTSLVSLSIGTGFERQLGVLKRLGATPLGREGLLAAKTTSVLVVEAMQTVVVLVAGLALGWRPSFVSPAAVLLALLLGTLTFTGAGFTLAGTLRAEANLAVANAIFVLLMLFGGIVVPSTRLPGVLAGIARVLPAEPLATALRVALTQGSLAAGPLAVLAAWAVVTCGAAATLFRWD